ncbi:MAG: DNA replication/repair protein RecF [Peptostreptococcaceae bacterium]
MHLQNLKLIDFRNYTDLYIEFNKDINLIIGKNGQGKTNIVEAIYLMSIGKSFRTNKDKEIIKFEKEKLYLAGNYQNKNNSSLIEFIIDKNKKGIRLNKISINKISELLGNLNVVIFSPEDLKLIKDGPRERRNFIDKEISQISPRYYNLLIDYNNILNQKNKYLKNTNLDHNLLDVYDEKLSSFGYEIYIFRKEFINKLNNIAKDIHNKLTNCGENLEITYKTKIESNDLDSKEKIKDNLFNKIKSYRNNDIKTRMTTFGIHRDDLDIYINNFEAKTFGSQGQQRMASISIKLSEIELIKREIGEYPILILDDVFSELDENRQKMLIDSLKGIQIFVTTAEKSHKNIFNKEITTIFSIEKGQVVKIENGGKLNE